MLWFKELHKKFKEREELENQVRPELEKARKRSRILLKDEDELLIEDRDSKLSLYLPGTSEEETSIQKELRVYLDEEHKAPALEAETQTHGEIEEVEEEQKSPEVSEKSIVALEDDKQVDEGKRSSRSFRAIPVFKEPESEEDEESRRERGKGNVEKWLHVLLENNNKDNPQDLQADERSKKIDEMIEKLDHKFPLLEKVNEEDVDEAKNNNINTKKVEETKAESSRRSRTSFDLKNTPEKNGRDKVVKRSESARAFRRIPSSPSLFFGMRKKPVVSGHDDENDYLVKTNFIKSSFQTIKRVVKF